MCVGWSGAPAHGLICLKSDQVKCSERPARSSSLRRQQLYAAVVAERFRLIGKFDRPPVLYPALRVWSPSPLISILGTMISLACLSTRARRAGNALAPSPIKDRLSKPGGQKEKPAPDKTLGTG